MTYLYSKIVGFGLCVPGWFVTYHPLLATWKISQVPSKMVKVFIWIENLAAISEPPIAGPSRLQEPISVNCDMWGGVTFHEA